MVYAVVKMAAMGTMPTQGEKGKRGRAREWDEETRTSTDDGFVGLSEGVRKTAWLCEEAKAG